MDGVATSNGISREWRSLRQAYAERYSESCVKRAIALAASHRARAARLGRTDHFTAWQWLDLCAVFNDRCAVCQEEGPLIVHHVKELSRGGPNSIGNIQPLCNGCHRYMHGGFVDLSAAWWAEQSALMERFRAGQAVRRAASPRGRRGIIIQTIPPQRGVLPLRGFFDSRVRFIVPVTKFSIGWVKAKANIRWFRRGEPYEREEDLEQLTEFE